MRLDELDEIFESTGSDHWSKMGPPTFLFSYVVSGLDDDARITAVEYHEQIAVLRADVDVRIAWGYDPDFGERDRVFFPEHTFPDPGIRVELGDVFYRGSLVDRYWLIAVDGGRAVLPMPHARLKAGVSRDGGLKPDDYEWYASSRDLAFARLVDDLSANREFDEYVRRAGLVVE